MGSCFSSDGSDSERREPAETSQIAPAPSERSRIAAEPAASEMAESAVTEESVHAEFISNHVAESEVTEEAGNAEVISNHGPEKHVRCKVFTYEELYSATDGFRADLFLGQGGFGTVYKGFLDSTNQVVAIKMLDPQGLQGDREFLTEVLVLSKLHHPNLVKLIGCCADRGQRLLVYEYMPLGALISHIHDLPPGKQPLDWSTRMKVLADAAKGLQHLHDNVDPPVINRDVKCGNILLGEEYHAKLSDFGLAKLGPTGDNTHVSTRILGTPGYCAPEYLMSGKLTIKSDIYSFGVVMLEVLTGRKAKDDSLAGPEQNLALWAPTLVNKEDFHKLADPTLQDEYHATSMYRALTVAAHCVNRTASKRPPIAHVVEALAEISEMESRSRKRSALQRSSAPGTPTGTKSGWDQAQDQEERS